MPDFDLIIRAGTVLTPDALAVADVGVCDGEIAAVGPDLHGTAREELDATGLHVLPGGIDAHMHADEPGRVSWEGFHSASTALAVGGMCSFFDMPLNSLPPTVTAGAFDLKLRAALEHSRLDFALWGGLVPGSVGHIEDLHRRGAIGFKAFMCDTGQPEYPGVDLLTLREGMKRCAELGAIVVVHAEDQGITKSLTEQARAERRLGVRDYVESRPAIAECAAIAQAIEVAIDTGCSLHIAHVSTTRGVEMVREAQSQAVDVSAETAPHYLVLVDEDMVRMGALAKCSPPMRSADDRKGLWEFVATDPRAIVASDHSPSPWADKMGDDFFMIWGGISAGQSTVAVLLNGCVEGKAGLREAISAVTCNVADRFGLPSKGAITPGRDADLIVVDLGEQWFLTSEELCYRHRHSALTGSPMCGRVKRTLSRGRTIVADGQPVGETRGRLMVPAERYSSA